MKSPRQATADAHALQRREEGAGGPAFRPPFARSVARPFSSPSRDVAGETRHQARPPSYLTRLSAAGVHHEFVDTVQAPLALADGLRLEGATTVPEDLQVQVPDLGHQPLAVWVQLT